MPKYRKKPIVIEAVQWFPEEPDNFWGTDRFGVEWTITDQTIKTAHGPVKMEPGVFIVTDPNSGDQWPVKPDIFAATYDEVVP